MDYAAMFAAGRSYDDFLAKFGTDEHRRRWSSFHKQVTLSDAQRELLGSFVREMHMVCVAGAWCGDCVNQCPIFAHFAAASPQIRLRFLDRDERPDLTGELKICGGARVPVVLLLSEDDQFVGLYGDRTLAKYRHIAATQLGTSCPTGLVADDRALVTAVVQDWLDEFERAHLILRTSARLRQLHND